MSYPNEARNAMILARIKAGESQADIARALGLNPRAISGIAFRDRHRATDAPVQPHAIMAETRQFRPVGPPLPSAPDSSSPKFANDDLHIGAVMACGGYDAIASKARPQRYRSIA